jgi:hypothetical protein
VPERVNRRERSIEGEGCVDGAVALVEAGVRLCRREEGGNWCAVVTDGLVGLGVGQGVGVGAGEREGVTMGKQAPRRLHKTHEAAAAAKGARRPRKSPQARGNHTTKHRRATHNPPKHTRHNPLTPPLSLYV